MRSIRPLNESDISLITDYFLDADHEFLKGMGVDVSKMFPREVWSGIHLAELQKPLEQKNFYFIIWEIDGHAVGHSSINKMIFGKEAFMHLHLWKPDTRIKGNGTWFVKESVKEYFERFQLKQLYCEPYALNEAPNRTLPKAGFRLVKEYVTTPGPFNFEQPVKQWVIEREELLLFE